MKNWAQGTSLRGGLPVNAGNALVIRQLCHDNNILKHIEAALGSAERKLSSQTINLAEIKTKKIK